MTDTWDPTNVHHKDVQHGIEVGDGIPEMRTITACRDALVGCGFEVVSEEDLADRDECVDHSFPLELQWLMRFYVSDFPVRSNGTILSKVT